MNRGVALAGCALPALIMSLPACTEEALSEPGPTDGLGTGPLDGLSRRFGRLRSRMRERGYSDEIGLARMFAAEGEGRWFMAARSAIAALWVWAQSR
ncbi:MAG: hypothetical protein AAGF12_08385 [Myxococcota bacterium]